MSIKTSFLSESRCQPHLAQEFLKNLGNTQQEDFYRRAIVAARQQNEPEVERQAIAWLAFSVQTRAFQDRILRNSGGN